MVRNRVRIARIIAAILTFALSTQVAEAQLVNCTMSGTHGNNDHAGMIQHQHRGHDAGSAATRSGSSDNQSSGAAACSQTMLCANVAANPTPATRPFHFENPEPQVSSGLSVIEARTLCPDPPPPRI